VALLVRTQAIECVRDCSVSAALQHRRVQLQPVARTVALQYVAPQTLRMLLSPGPLVNVLYLVKQSFFLRLTLPNLSFVVIVAREVFV
jgi:hypothetical protein